jgi:hypothetical protein
MLYIFDTYAVFPDAQTRVCVCVRARALRINVFYFQSIQGFIVSSVY